LTWGSGLSGRTVAGLVGSGPRLALGGPDLGSALSGRTVAGFKGACPGGRLREAPTPACLAGCRAWAAAAGSRGGDFTRCLGAVASNAPTAPPQAASTAPVLRAALPAAPAQWSCGPISLLRLAACAALARLAARGLRPAVPAHASRPAVPARPALPSPGPAHRPLLLRLMPCAPPLVPAPHLRCSGPRPAPRCSSTPRTPRSSPHSAGWLSARSGSAVWWGF
jgi:hypothetical protein